MLALIPPAPDPVAEALSTEHLPEQMRVRRAKLDRIRAAGIDPYPVSVAAHAHRSRRSAAEVGDLAPDTETGHRVSVAGRVLLKRDMGGLGFATLRDGSGDLQVMVDAQHAGRGRAWRSGSTRSTSATTSASRAR